MKIAHIGRMLRAALMIAILPQGSACAEHTVGGRTAAAIFVDPELTKLANAACVGNFSGITDAIRAGANPNGTGDQGMSVLGWAVGCENVAGIEALLKAGADPNRIMGGRYSAMYLSVDKTPKIIGLMISYGGDVNSIDSNGMLILERAFSDGNSGKGWENYNILIESGADINRPDGVGLDIAISAALVSRYDKVDELLRRGYKRDLPELLRFLSKSDRPEFEKYRLSSIEIIRERGVLNSSASP